MVSELGVTTTAPVGVIHEEVVARFRPHAGNLLWSALGFILITFGYAFVAGFLTEPWMQIVAVIVYGVLIVFVVIIPWLVWLVSGVTLTTQRVIITRGLIHRVRREILYVRVTDVTLRRSPIQMAFGSGDLMLGVGTEQPVRVHAVPKPNLVVAALTELVFRANPRAR